MEKFAIVGISCLFPGARTPMEYWQNLLDGRDLSSLAGVEQLGVDPEELYHPARRTPDKLYSLRGGYIRDFSFNPADFPALAGYAEIDNLFKWSLYVAREALVDSGYIQSAPVLGTTGVVLGNLSFPTRLTHRLLNPIYGRVIEAALRDLLNLPSLTLPELAGGGDAAPLNMAISGGPAALVAAALGLGKISFGLDAACASSLYAVKLACQQLALGNADMMLAGAVSCADPFDISMGFSIFQAFPSEGEHSRPLDRRSKGLIAAEGAGMFAIKRLADAQRDGDRIYAVIAGAGLSNDGRGKHLLTPNVRGQMLAFERAYAEAGLHPHQIDYIECHATGTPLGDITELNSMEAFFAGQGLNPWIGSSKSNFGHLLTAAGMAGMTKIILSMTHGKIPPTIKVDEPLNSEGGLIGAGRVVNRAIDWPETTPGERRGAVSAFGFGGVNAHLILEDAAAAGTASSLDPLPAGNLAIVGMEAFFGPYQNLAAFERAIFRGEQGIDILPERRWQGLLEYNLAADEVVRGAFIDEFDLDFLRYRIPPAPEDRPIPQQLLMLRVADAAIRDAGLQEGGRVAVIVAMGAELALHQFRGRVDLGWQIRDALEEAGLTLNEEELAELVKIARNSLAHWPEVNRYTSFIGNIIASRISAQWDFNGPSFTLSSDENSTAKAIEVARAFLSMGEAEAVVVAAVDLAGGAEHVLLRGLLGRMDEGEQAPTLSFGQSEPGWLPGDGAGAVVLKREPDASQAGDRIYAVIEGIGFAQAQPGAPSVSATEAACRSAFSQAGVTPGAIGYVEAHASGFPAEDQVEIAALWKVYSPGAGEGPRAMGSIKATSGHAFHAAGMASLIKTALCLHHGSIPPVPGWSVRAWSAPDGVFYHPTGVHPWLCEGTRRAAINGMGLDGAHSHIVLREGGDMPAPVNGQPSLLLLPVAAHDPSELLAELVNLAAIVEQALSPGEAASEAFKRYRQHEVAPYAAVILGVTRADLLDEIELALQAAPAAFSNGKPWLSRRGSVLVPRPIGKDAKVAFVYPGGFNAYIGLGTSLFHRFGDLYSRFGQMVDDPIAAIGAERLYPRLERAPSRDEEALLRQALEDDKILMQGIGTAFAMIYTLLMQGTFKVKADAALGYSMGESSMMFALGVWGHAEEGFKRLRESPLFRTRLSGVKQAARDYLNIPPEAPDDFWGTYVIRAPVEAVRAAIAQERGVFLTHIDTPQEVALCGLVEPCLRVIKQLGAPFVPAAQGSVLHCDAMRSEYDTLMAFHGHPVAARPPVVFYSSSTYGPIELDSENIARSLAETICSLVDFPRLVDTVYGDGVRVFIELGPRNTCTGWIADILKGREHVAIATNRKGQNDEETVLRALALLTAHRIPADLSPLYAPIQAADGRSLVKTITTGGAPVAHTILSQANRSRFGNLSDRLERFAVNVVPDSLVPVLEAGVPEGNWEHKMSHDWESRPVVGGQRSLGPIESIALGAGRVTEGHLTFLYTHQQAQRQLGEALAMQLDQMKAGAGRPAGPCVWDEADLLEFAGGKIANVFGPEYGVIDTYSRRVRLPLPPYLLVSRVTEIEGTLHEYKPSRIVTEYDIPHGAWYTVDGQIPWAISVESGQCDLLLISYLGIDFQNKGELVYRLLDCTLTFLEDLPKEGDTLRYDIRINSYAQHGRNLLFFFSYECFVDDRMVLKMDNGCAGFFSDQDLAEGRGVIMTESELEARRRIPKQRFTPLLRTPKTSISREEMLHLTRGEVAAVFGEAYDQDGLNPSLRLPPEAMLMIDRITSIDPQGGPWGLGELIAEKDLHPDHWYFPCHFMDDQVMAGSLVAEGCGQLMQAYMLWLGLQSCAGDARFQPVPGLPQVVRCRGQITPTIGKLIYRMEITGVGLDPRPYTTANVDVILDGKVVVRFEGLGLQLSEKDPAIERFPQRIKVEKPEARWNEQHLEEFALGSMEACFGPEYAVYHQKRTPRTPNGLLNLISRVLTFEGDRHQFHSPAHLVSEYDVPEDAWFITQNAAPVTPYGIIMEMALQPCGFLAVQMGTPLLYPEADMYFRNLDGAGHLLWMPELRGKTVTNQVTLNATTTIPGIILQSYQFCLSVEGRPFYVGDADFGYFLGDALRNQVGLDNGQAVAPWRDQVRMSGHSIALSTPEAARYFQPPTDKPFYRLAGGRLNFLDEVLITGGAPGMHGYLYGRKQVNPADWFFASHFFLDPVMPGSLGLEAVLQAMQVYAIHLDAGQYFRSPYFTPSIDSRTVWKYRGQITPANREMTLEAHINSLEWREGMLVLRASASVWRDGLRIYEITDLALGMSEAG